MIPLRFILLDFFPEHEHSVSHTPVTFLLFRNCQTVLMLVPELDNMEAAAVHVEVDVTFLEVWGDCFPDADLRMHRFHGLPSGLADTFAVAFRKDKQQFKLAFRRPPSGRPGRFGRLRLSLRRWNPLSSCERLPPLPPCNAHHASRTPAVRILERPLVVQDKLLPVFGLQRDEYDLRLFHLHR